MHRQAKTYSDYIYSIEYFIKKMVDPGEDFPPEEKPVLKIDDFKQVFKIVKENLQSNIFGSSDASYSNEVLCFLSVLKSIAYFIIDEVEVSSIYRASKEVLERFVGNSSTKMNQQIAISLEIYQALNKYFGALGGDS